MEQQQPQQQQQQQQQQQLIRTSRFENDFEADWTVKLGRGGYGTVLFVLLLRSNAVSSFCFPPSSCVDRADPPRRFAVKRVVYRGPETLREVLL